MLKQLSRVATYSTWTPTYIHIICLCIYTLYTAHSGTVVSKALLYTLYLYAGDAGFAVVLSTAGDQVRVVHHRQTYRTATVVRRLGHEPHVKPSLSSWCSIGSHPHLLRSTAVESLAVSKSNRKKTETAAKIQH